jgi:cytosine/adenosine deaminase-related metal-dependent hydrolase
MKVRSGVTPDLSNIYLDGRTVSVRLDQGRIAAIEPAPGPATAVILPLAVDAHVHLDKTFTAHRCRAEKPGLFGAIEAMPADKANWTEADLRARIGRGLRDAASNGVAAMRSHVDWTEPGMPLAWAVMGEAAQDWHDRIVLQRAAWPQLTYWPMPIAARPSPQSSPKMAAYWAPLSTAKPSLRPSWTGCSHWRFATA